MLDICWNIGWFLVLLCFYICSITNFQKLHWEYSEKMATVTQVQLDLFTKRVVATLKKTGRRYQMIEIQLVWLLLWWGKKIQAINTFFFLHGAGYVSVWVQTFLGLTPFDHNPSMTKKRRCQTHGFRQVNQPSIGNMLPHIWYTFTLQNESVFGHLFCPLAALKHYTHVKIHTYIYIE